MVCPGCGIEAVGGANYCDVCGRKLTETAAEQKIISAPAGIARMIAAAALDLLIVFLVSLFFYGILHVKSTPALIAGFLTVYMFYFSFFLFYCGQTMGNMLFKTRVIGGNNGSPAFFEIISRVLVFIIGLLSVFGVLMAVFREDKKGLHDIISGTEIVSIC